MPRNTAISFSSKDAETGTEIEVDGEGEGKEEVEVDGEGEGKQETEVDGEREGKLEIEDEEDSEAKFLFCFDFFLKKSTIVAFRFIFVYTT